MSKNALVGKFVFVEQTKLYGQIMSEVSPGFVMVEYLYNDGTLRGTSVTAVRDLVNSPLFSTQDELLRYAKGGK